MKIGNLSLSRDFYVKDPQLSVRFLALLRINKDISKSKGRGPKVQILNSETRN